MMRLSTRAIGWRLDRRDGWRIGFTSHDRTAWLGGLAYRPQPGLKLTSIRRSGAWEPGGLDIEGAIDSELLSAADLAAGRWTGAAIHAFSYDWSDESAPPRPLLDAHIGKVGIEAGLFRAELIEARPRAAAGLVPRSAPGCRALFCGPDCGLSPARFRHEMRIVALVGAVVTLDAAPAGALFAGGSLRWLSGGNCGLRQSILDQDGADLTLAMPPAFAPDPLAKVELIEGCDKDLATCAGRFDNAVNFRGEPLLPGMDYLTRYPGG